jgi:hypothetical protein
MHHAEVYGGTLLLHENHAMELGMHHAKVYGGTL